MAANVPPAAAAAAVAGAAPAVPAGAAAGAIVLAAVAPGAPALPSTYAEKFRLDGDTLNGDYTALYQRFLNVGAIDENAYLGNVAFTRPSKVPQVFLYAGTVGGELKVRCFHRVSMFRGNPIVPCPYDGSVLAITGDILAGNLFNMVNLLANVYVPHANVDVPTNGTIEALVQALPDDDSLLDPIVNGAPDTKTVNTHQSVPVPQQLAEFVLKANWTPKQAFLAVHAEIARLGIAANTVQPLLDWLRVVIQTLSDNTPAVAWRNKGSTTTTGPAAYLLHWASLQQRKLGHVPRVHYIPGPDNHLVDLASRNFAMTDDQLLTHLNEIAPQKITWRMLHLPPEKLSMLMSAVTKSHLPIQSMPNANDVAKTPGTNAGSPFYPSSESMTPTSSASMTKSPFYVSLPSDYVTGNSHLMVNPSKLTQLVTSQIYLIVLRFPLMGFPNPTLNEHGIVDDRLKLLYTGMRNADPAPERVKPLPIQALHHAHTTIMNLPFLEIDHAAMVLLWIGFFFLLKSAKIPWYINQYYFLDR